MQTKVLVLNGTLKGMRVLATIDDSGIRMSAEGIDYLLSPDDVIEECYIPRTLPEGLLQLDKLRGQCRGGNALDALKQMGEYIDLLVLLFDKEEHD